MWERSELKRRAKDVLRTSYWKAFLVSIILAFVGGGGSLPGIRNNLNFRSSYSSDNFDFSGIHIDWRILVPLLTIAIFVFTIVLLLTLALRIFLLSPLEAGSMRYFKQAAEHEVSLSHIGYAFNKDRYMDIVKTMLWRGFLNFLWFLLFFIPGIVKSYAYSLVPFILADNPNIGYRRAVDLSREMTRGHKFRMFVLDLSFLGWILLGLLALFIGVLFVMPYINAAKAELYLALRQQALRNGLTTEEELRLNWTPFYK